MEGNPPNTNTYIKEMKKMIYVLFNDRHQETMTRRQFEVLRTSENYKQLVFTYKYL